MTSQKPIESILSAVINLEVSRGHLKWKMAELSRASGVKRTLIYYYFSKDKKDLFKQAVQYYADVFLDFRIERAQKIAKGEIIDLILEARARLRKHPYFLQFYAKHRLLESEAAPIFNRAEKRYFENLKASLPARRKHLARPLWALIFGLALQPGLTELDLKETERFIRRAWRK
jgi:AcrR family transcriptional regulator